MNLTLKISILTQNKKLLEVEVSTHYFVSTTRNKIVNQFVTIGANENGVVISY